MTKPTRVLIEMPIQKPGRRKAQVLQIFNEHGPEAAWTLGLKLGLKDTTLRVWLCHWYRDGVTSTSRRY